MNKLKLKIVSIHIKNSPQGMPLAAGMLKAQLDSVPEIKRGFDVSLAEFYVGNSAETIAESLLEEKNDLIGFSIYLWNRDIIENVCRNIKNATPGIILFAGGAEATALPERLLARSRFDFVISGEGEFALTETVKRIIVGKAYDDIEGLFVKDKIYIHGQNQCTVNNLDSLPSPFLGGVIDLKKYSGILWELSRGCPFKCSFCFESRGVAGVREFSLDRLQRELELFESEKVTQVFVLDPTFNRNADRAKKILRMILNTAPMIHFTFEVRTEFIDNEMAELFSAINCSLQIGLQSADPAVLARLNRKIDTEKFAEKISLLNYHGVVFGLDLIYGLPGDTLSGFKSSLDYALRLQPNHLDIFPLAVLPGTVLYDQADSLRLNYLKDAPYILLSHPDFSEADMETAGLLKKGCDIFYNQGGAAGWMFMVYETLGIKPSELIIHFTNYLTGENIASEPDEKQRIHIQTLFIKKMFDEYGVSGLYPIMKDIIAIHGAMNSSLYAGPSDEKSGNILEGDTCLKLSSGTRFLELKFNFNDLMQIGEYNLEEFQQSFLPEKTSVIIYNYRGEVKPLIADHRLVALIGSFSATGSLNEKLSDDPSLDRDESVEFIEYALSETILTVA